MDGCQNYWQNQWEPDIFGGQGRLSGRFSQHHPLDSPLNYTGPSRLMPPTSNWED